MEFTNSIFMEFVTLCCAKNGKSTRAMHGTLSLPSSFLSVNWNLPENPRHLPTNPLHQLSICVPTSEAGGTVSYEN
jgi:hypothetical protein